MNIVHICLCGSFVDGWDYQENVMAKFHAKAGHNVTIIASQWEDTKELKITKTIKTNYINKDGVKIIRLSIKYGKNSNYRLKQYNGLIEAVENENPNILFIHGCQFLDILKLVDYAKKKDIRIYVDNHADFFNSATNLLSKYLLHGIIWKYCAKKIEPYIEKFYGVLPARVDFLINVYKLSKEKVELLVMGADDGIMKQVNESNSRDKIRQQYNILSDDFLLVTGGKIDMAKARTLLLAEAVRKIENKHLKLIIFGSIMLELKEELLSMCDGNKIQYIGWADGTKSYEYFLAADLAVFPGSHSVYWEQAAGQGIPLLVKDWPGMHHVDIGGNADFLVEDRVEEIQRKIEILLNEPQKYKKMKRIAVEKGMKIFSYKNISEKCIS